MTTDADRTSSAAQDRRLTDLVSLREHFELEARSRRIAWCSACAVMFAAVPAGIVLLRLHELTAGYTAFGIAAALECFFVGWFVGRYSHA